MSLLVDWHERLFDKAEQVLSDAVDDDAQWAILCVLKTAGARRGYCKYRPKPPEPLPPAANPMDLGRLSDEDRKRYDFLRAVTRGFRDGVVPPDAEFIQRLDRDIDQVRQAFSEARGRESIAAEKLNVSLIQLQEYLVRRPRLWEAVGGRVEALVDRAEAALWRTLEEEKKWAVQFMIKTFGHTRGYSENPRDEIPRPMPEVKDAVDLRRLGSDDLIELDNLEDKARGIEPFDPWMKICGMPMPKYNTPPPRLD